MSPGTYKNLNLDTDHDQDWFRLTFARPTKITIDLAFMSALGTVTLGDGYGLQAEQVGGGRFEQVTWRTSTNALSTFYEVPAGSYLMKVSGRVNAYDLPLTWSAQDAFVFPVNPDGYEPNGSFMTALGCRGRGARVHHRGRCGRVPLREPGQHRQPLPHDLGRLRHQVDRRPAHPPALRPLRRPRRRAGVERRHLWLQPGVLQSSGRNLLRHSVGQDARRHRELRLRRRRERAGRRRAGADCVYQRVHPGDPVEGVFRDRFDGYLFTHSPLVSAIHLLREPLGLALLDVAGNVLGSTESTFTGQNYDATLSLAGAVAGTEYLVQIVSRASAVADVPVANLPSVAYTLTWDAPPPTAPSI